MKGLKQVRERAGRSQQEVADAVGVAQNSVYRWESGLRTPSIEYVVKLAKYFGVTTDELINGPSAEPPSLAMRRKHYAKGRQANAEADTSKTRRKTE